MPSELPLVGALMGVIVVPGVLNPTSLAPTLVSPASGDYLDLSGTPTFTWQYNPGQSGNQTGWLFLRLSNGGSVPQYGNVGSTTWQSTPVVNTGSIQSYTFPSGAWVNGNIYQWAMQTHDANAVGALSGYFTLTAQAVPMVPSPRLRLNRHADPLVTWTVALARGAQQTSYRVVFTPAPSTPPADSLRARDHRYTTAPAGVVLRLLARPLGHPRLPAQLDLLSLLRAGHRDGRSVLGLGLRLIHHQLHGPRDSIGHRGGGHGWGDRLSPHQHHRPGSGQSLCG